MRRRKTRLSQQDLREMGCTPGRIITRYVPDGRRATVRQVLGEAKPPSLFCPRAQTDVPGKKGGQQSKLR